MERRREGLKDRDRNRDKLRAKCARTLAHDGALLAVTVRDLICFQLRC